MTSYLFTQCTDFFERISDIAKYLAMGNPVEDYYWDTDVG